MYLREIVTSIFTFLLFSIIFLKATQAQNIPIVANVNNEDILILSIIDLSELGGSALIREKGFSIKTIIDYD